MRTAGTSAGQDPGRATLHLKAFRLVPPPSRVASAEAVIGTPVQRDKAVLEADDGWDIVAENLA